MIYFGWILYSLWSFEVTWTVIQTYVPFDTDNLKSIYHKPFFFFWLERYLNKLVPTYFSKKIWPNLLIFPMCQSRLIFNRLWTYNELNSYLKVLMTKICITIIVVGKLAPSSTFWNFLFYNRRSFNLNFRGQKSQFHFFHKTTPIFFNLTCSQEHMKKIIYWIEI